jgi:Ca-activated chloride channel family protein
MNTGHLPAGDPAREPLDSLLTAYALGQLAGAELAAAERLLAGPTAAELRAQVAEIRLLAETLRGTRETESVGPSPDLRRAVVAACASATSGKAAPAAEGRVAKWPWGMLAVLAGGGLAAAVMVAGLPALRSGLNPDREVAQLQQQRNDASRDGLANGPASRRQNEQSERAKEPPPAAAAPQSASGKQRNAAEYQKGDEVAASAAAPLEQRAAAKQQVGQGQGAGGRALAGPAASSPTAKERERLAEEAKGSSDMPRDPAAPAESLARSLPPPKPVRIKPGDDKAKKAAPTGETQLASDGLAVEASESVPAAPMIASIDAVGGSGGGYGGRSNANRVGENGTLKDQRFTADSDRETTFAKPDAGDLQRKRLEEKESLRGDESRERYGAIVENRFLSSADHPLSTFSVDVDTASYANVRRFLMAGRLPPRDAVRLEELINYFRYDLPQPGGDEPFSVTVEAADCPWRSGRTLVRVGLQGREIDRRERPAGNLVFLVDVSGSMSAENKLPLVKQALAMLVEELTENDMVSIVTYAGNAGLRLPPTSGDQKGKILTAIESLSAGGSTHGSAGIAMAYEQAAERYIKGGVNRVILATDGDLNVGVTSNEALVELVSTKAKGGTFLTVLGFGDGNLQDDKLEQIADRGNGIYAYIDGAREARKVLVEQLTGSTITIAKDVKIQVEFNPAQVASYRLLGYENRIMAAEDFRNDRKDAGDIGAGHSVTALYEVVTVGAAAGEPGAGAEPLKYQPRPEPVAVAKPAGPVSTELLTVKLRYKQPDGDTSVLREVPLANRGGEFAAASKDLRFAAAVAAFGMLLRGSEYKGAATFSSVAEIAGGALGTDASGYRAEFLDLVRKAQESR